jgi:hypothetical protein
LNLVQSDLDLLSGILISIWTVYLTPMTLPWIGTTTPLYMTLFLMLIQAVAYGTYIFLGGKDENM